MRYNFDPELAGLVAALPESDFSDVKASRVGIRTLVAAFNGDIDASGLAIEDRNIPGPAGAPEVPVRIYSPENLPAVTAGFLYIHGGGFVVGDLETEHGGAVAVAKELGVVVVSVDYRLAPEDPFPAGLEDCYAALQWLYASAAALGVDSKRIGIGGQSAGGGLAAGLALLARDRGGPAICFQFLGIPELDDRLETPSMRAFVDTPLWNRPNAELSWQFYLRGSAEPGSAEVSPYAAPARAEDLSGLPPAYVSVMQFDPLRDEGIAYAQRLLYAGIHAELHAYPGTFHGSSFVVTAAISQREKADMMAGIGRGLRVLDRS